MKNKKAIETLQSYTDQIETPKEGNYHWRAMRSALLAWRDANLGDEIKLETETEGFGESARVFFVQTELAKFGGKVSSVTVPHDIDLAAPLMPQLKALLVCVKAVKAETYFPHPK